MKHRRPDRCAITRRGGGRFFGEVLGTAKCQTNRAEIPNDSERATGFEPATACLGIMMSRR